MESWREWLYPFGFISTLAFTTRFAIQWWMSEKEGRSANPPLFWQLSLFGNVSLLIHSIIQVHFPIAIFQSCQAVISWRNLDLMRPEIQRYSFRQTVLIMISALCATTLFFLVQGMWEQPDQPIWIRIPSSFIGAAQVPIDDSWHVLGILGLMLFSARFWVQWFKAEKKQASRLGPSFWWLSLMGASFLIAYFLKQKDWVNLSGPLFGLIPYIRNLILLRSSYHNKQEVMQ